MPPLLSLFAVISQTIVQVALLAVVIYFALLYLRNTPAAPILAGIVISTFVAWVLSETLGLEVIGWILARLPAFLMLAVLIIFQPEFRRILAEIGTNPKRFLDQVDENVDETIDALVRASFRMAEQRDGALIAIERSIGMRSYIEEGIAVRAPVSPELLVTIFYKGTPLHDGAVIIKGGMIEAANCFFPLTDATVRHELGTRHRAAIGVTEQTDAVVIVVSEERGWVSVAHRGTLVQKVDELRLRRHLTNYLKKRQGGRAG